MIDASPLTSRYIMLQKADALQEDADERALAREQELDRLYRQIITLPVLSLADAIDKLAFANHCLMEEFDIKEASNLICEVSAALLILNRAANNPTALHLTRKCRDEDEADNQSGGDAG